MSLQPLTAQDRFEGAKLLSLRQELEEILHHLPNMLNYDQVRLNRKATICTSKEHVSLHIHLCPKAGKITKYLSKKAQTTFQNFSYFHTVDQWKKEGMPQLTFGRSITLHHYEESPLLPELILSLTGLGQVHTIQFTGKGNPRDLAPLSALPSLERLKFKVDALFKGSIIDAIQEFTQLRQLKMNRYHFQTSDHLNILKLVKLESLELQEPAEAFTEEQFRAICQLTDLRSLKYAFHPKKCNNTTLTPLARLTLLENLSLSGYVEPHSYNRIEGDTLTLCSHLSRLKSLSIELVEVDENGFEALGRLPHLQTVHIKHCLFSHPAMRALKFLQQLQDLTLSHICLVTDLLSAIAKTPVKRLTLHDCHSFPSNGYQILFKMHMLTQLEFDTSLLKYCTEALKLDYNIEIPADKVRCFFDEAQLHTIRSGLKAQPIVPYVVAD